MAKVYWKEPERQQVAHRAYEYLQAGEHESWGECMDAAQHMMLDPDRQRPRSSLASESVKLKELGKTLWTKSVELEAKATAETNRRIAELHERVHVEAPTSKPILTEPPTANIDKLDAALNVIVDHIGEEFSAKLIAKLNLVLSEAFSKIDSSIGNRLPAITSKSMPPKPRILIVGMLPKHATEIKKDFDEYFDMEFVETDKTTQLKSKAAGKDRVILNTKFLNHSIQSVVRDHPGLVLAHGNNVVKDELLALAVALY
jgi:hypothetical protein